MKRTIVALALVLPMGWPLLACERKQGPMEKAGEKIDEAVESIAHPNEGPLEKAGRKAEEAVETAKEKLE
jgi:hypothetical protein